MFQQQWKLYKQEFKEALEDLKTKGRRKYQIPNILTSFRLLAPFVILPLAAVGNMTGTLIATGAFALTDCADGFIARKFHLTSNLGKDLDAFCDKLFAGTLLLASSVINPMMLLTLGLEGVIGSINVKSKLKGYQPQSLYIGKLKTLFLFPLLGISFLGESTIFPLLFASTTSLQVLTTVAYQRKYKKIEKEQKAKELLSSKIPKEEIEIEQENAKKGISHVIEKEISSATNQEVQTLKELKKILLQEIGIEEERHLEGEKTYYKDK